MWRFRSHIYALDSQIPWASSHAQIPTVLFCGNDHLDVYFASRDKLNRSHICKMRVSADEPHRIIEVNPLPVLGLGSPGTFDDSGVMPSSILEVDGLHYLYYIGWNARLSVPYHNAVGLAISEDGGCTFNKVHDGPIMDRTKSEPYFCATTCVRKYDDLWRNWYLSSTGWEQIDRRMEPHYNIKYAESVDGIDWNRSGKVAIDNRNSGTEAIARASVLSVDNGYRMWFCYRGLSNYREGGKQSYRIGQAYSADGEAWSRDDSAFDVTASGHKWDSKMQAYPEVIEVEGTRYLFYNGNGFGSTGFGYSEWCA